MSSAPRGGGVTAADDFRAGAAGPAGWCYWCLRWRCCSCSGQDQPRRRRWRSVNAAAPTPSSGRPCRRPPRRHHHDRPRHLRRRPHHRRQRQARRGGLRRDHHQRRRPGADDRRGRRTQRADGDDWGNRHRRGHGRQPHAVQRSGRRHLHSPCGRAVHRRHRHDPQQRHSRQQRRPPGWRWSPTIRAACSRTPAAVGSPMMGRRWTTRVSDNRADAASGWPATRSAVGSSTAPSAISRFEHSVVTDNHVKVTPPNGRFAPGGGIAMVAGKHDHRQPGQRQRRRHVLGGAHRRRAGGDGRRHPDPGQRLGDDSQHDHHRQLGPLHQHGR